ncbi:probable methyltransferase-like protein 24 isoform X2 [Panulirus ornatus]|uniref:probable methyltransferase-like protein 24 isoform X2 n=1 Tax=Panulirus ornatus TaxID=150431 RepID=UPI003A8A6386
MCTVKVETLTGLLETSQLRRKDTGVEQQISLPSHQTLPLTSQVSSPNEEVNMVLMVRWNMALIALAVLLIFFITLILSFRGEGRTNLNPSSIYKDQGIPVGSSEAGCVVQPLVNLSQLRHYLNTVEAPCMTMRQFGGRAPAAHDGLKLACLDCQYNIQPGSCIVLSFGVNNDWGFEDDFAEYNCKVHSFDPTMDVEDHQRAPNIQFYRLGLSNYKGTKSLGQMRGSKKMSRVDRYENILKRLNLTDSVIDYLKIDIELSELDFFQDMFFSSPHLLRNIKQIGMEVHHKLEGVSDVGGSSVYQQFWKYYQLMHCYGFRVILMYTHSRRSMWREVLWGRLGDCSP